MSTVELNKLKEDYINEKKAVKIKKEEEMRKLMPIGTVFCYGFKNFAIVKYGDKSKVFVFDTFQRKVRELYISDLFDGIDITGKVEPDWLAQYILLC